MYAKIEENVAICWQWLEWIELDLHPIRILTTIQYYITGAPVWYFLIGKWWVAVGMLTTDSTITSTTYHLPPPLPPLPLPLPLPLPRSRRRPSVSKYPPTHHIWLSWKGIDLASINVDISAPGAPDPIQMSPIQFDYHHSNLVFN